MKLKNPIELGELLNKIESGNEDAFEEYFGYIDSLHNKVMEYQLIIDNIYHNVKDNVRIVTL